MITCCNVFNVWPKTTLLPVWPRDTKSLVPPGMDFRDNPAYSVHLNQLRIVGEKSEAGACRDSGRKWHQN